jgi:pseudouridine synthase
MRPIKTLERVLSKAGVGSRTEARAWIAAGRVRVNGKSVRDPDVWVDLERDRVEFDGKPLRREKRVYLLLYKPTGYLTTRKDPEGRPTVFDLPDVGRALARPDGLKPVLHLFSAGRLDLDTSGLLILTNDAQFAEQLTNPEYHVPKTYLVKANRHLSDDELNRLRKGIELRDGPTRPAKVERLREAGGKTVFEITITEGRNRQVRRMVEALEGKVLKLVRVAIGAIRIGDLQMGKARELTPDEVRALTHRPRAR